MPHVQNPFRFSTLLCIALMLESRRLAYLYNQHIAIRGTSILAKEGLPPLPAELRALTSNRRGWNIVTHASQISIFLWKFVCPHQQVRRRCLLPFAPLAPPARLPHFIQEPARALRLARCQGTRGGTCALRMCDAIYCCGSRWGQLCGCATDCMCLPSCGCRVPTHAWVHNSTFSSASIPVKP